MACNDPLSLVLTIGVNEYDFSHIQDGVTVALLTGGIVRENMGAQLTNHNPWLAEYMFTWTLDKLPDDPDPGDCGYDDTFLQDVLDSCYPITLEYMGTEYEGLITSPNLDAIIGRQLTRLQLIFTGFKV